ncbi:MAG TPA: FAD-dependent oxidoreductase [Terriglobales bacterium]|nr:FAD-dependent oxidoreductase [Terriglobales bacterium]
MKRIVILGGGFGGVYAARWLEKLLRPGEADICLINREDYFVFQPLLPEVISGSIGLLDTISPIRRLCPRTRLYVRDVDSIDLAHRIVRLTPTFRPRKLELPYDCLVIAVGSTDDFSRIPGLADHAIPFRNLGDALRLRNAALHALEEADNETDPDFRRTLLTFVVAGGGFSGIEVMAELNDFVRAAVRHFHSLRQEEISCVLVHSGDRILPEITAELALYAQKLLAKRGVTLKLNARLAAASADSAVLSTGETILTRTLVSTVPAGPVPLIQSLDCEKERGKLPTNSRLELKGYEGQVWVLGDCAAIHLDDGSTAPPTAQHAAREARIAAVNIAAALRGQPQTAFAFRGLGKMGSLGHHSAVAEVLGFCFSGFLAWFLWRTIYLMKLPGLNRKLRVALDWLTALLFPTDLVQLRVQASSTICTGHFERGETVFQQGDLGDSMYVVRSGEVEIIRDGVGVTRLGAGEYFGELALLRDHGRSATVRATQPTDVLLIPKREFVQLLAAFPEFSASLVGVAAQRGAGVAQGPGPSNARELGDS